MQARRAAFAALPEQSTCARCGHTLWKWAVEPDGKGGTRSALHWDHTDIRDGYLGFSHASDNRSAGARKAIRARQVRAGQQQRRQSRNW